MTVETTKAPNVKTVPRVKFVTVASKLPMSIEIQLCKQQESRVTGQFGSTTENIFVKHGKGYIIRGIAYPVGQPPEGYPDKPDMKNGYALTPGVDADFFAEWMKQNQTTDMVANGVVMAEADVPSIAARTADHKHVDSGLSPIDPKGDPRSPKPLNSLIQAVKPESRAAA